MNQPSLNPSLFYFPPITRRPTKRPTIGPTEIPTGIPTDNPTSTPSLKSSQPIIIITSQSVSSSRSSTDFIIIIFLSSCLFLCSILLCNIAYDRYDRRQRTLRFLKWNTIQNKSNDILILRDQFQRERYDSEEGHQEDSVNDSCS
jgi:hypothetical protein